VVSKTVGKIRYLLIFLLLMTAGAALAQDGEVPKFDVFVGYQWLNPGATVATTASDVSTGSKLPDFAKGVGGSATYNFSKIVGVSVDAGINAKNDFGHEATISIGPRVMWRGEGINMFAHTMFGWNQLKAGDFDARNGIGAILGGGMDIGITRW